MATAQWSSTRHYSPLHATGTQRSRCVRYPKHRCILLAPLGYVYHLKNLDPLETALGNRVLVCTLPKQPQQGSSRDGTLLHYADVRSMVMTSDRARDVRTSTVARDRYLQLCEARDCTRNDHTEGHVLPPVRRASNGVRQYMLRRLSGCLYLRFGHQIHALSLFLFLYLFFFFFRNFVGQHSF